MFVCVYPNCCSRLCPSQKSFQGGSCPQRVGRDSCSDIRKMSNESQTGTIELNNSNNSLSTSRNASTHIIFFESHHTLSGHIIPFHRWGDRLQQVKCSPPPPPRGRSRKVRELGVKPGSQSFNCCTPVPLHSCPSQHLAFVHPPVPLLSWPQVSPGIAGVLFKYLFPEFSTLSISACCWMNEHSNLGPWWSRSW